MAKKNIRPDFVISSSSVRTKLTCELLLPFVFYDYDQVEFSYDLYHTDEYKILDCINKQSDSIQTLYLFGHNPGLNSLVNKLTNQNLSNIPTTGICIIEVESFENLKLGTGQLIDFLYPKQYK